MRLLEVASRGWGWGLRDVSGCAYRNGGGGMEILGRESVFFLETQGGNLTLKYRY